jgi:hypothetical protein
MWTGAPIFRVRKFGVLNINASLARTNDHQRLVMLSAIDGSQRHSTYISFALPT